MRKKTIKKLTKEERQEILNIKKDKAFLKKAQANHTKGMKALKKYISWISKDKEIGDAGLLQAIIRDYFLLNKIETIIPKKRKSKK